MKKLLITRPKEEADSLAESLLARGLSAVIEPMLHIEPVARAKSLLKTALENTPQAILITSRRALDILSEVSHIRNVPLFLVGSATARLAGTLGFTDVYYSETAGALGSLIMRHCKPGASPLLYVHGEFTSTDIVTPLAGKGFHVESVVLYRAHAAEAFSAPLCTLIAEGQLAGALFFSARTAEIYLKLARIHTLAQQHNTMTAICMSDAVATKLHALPWKEIRIADTPDMDHMLKLAETL